MGASVCLCVCRRKGARGCEWEIFGASKRFLAKNHTLRSGTIFCSSLSRRSAFGRYRLSLLRYSLCGSTWKIWICQFAHRQKSWDVGVCIFSPYRYTREKLKADILRYPCLWYSSIWDSGASFSTLWYHPWWQKSSLVPRGDVWTCSRWLTVRNSKISKVFKAHPSRYHDDSSFWGCESGFTLSAFLSVRLFSDKYHAN